MNDPSWGSTADVGPDGIRVPPGILTGFDELVVHNLAAFLEQARRLLPDFGSRQIWYRGHASADWRLVPSVFRSYDPIGERVMLTRFMQGAPTRYPKCPGIYDFPEWLSLAQHYGLPTRMLDWSASALVGLYFALMHEPPRPEPAAVWAIAPSLLNASATRLDQIFLLRGSEVVPFVEAAFGRASQVQNSMILAVKGQDVDVRLAVQQGAFTIHGGLVPLERIPYRRGILFKFVIPDEHKASFASELRSLGIRRSSLFPDLEHLAAEIAEEQLLYP